MSKRLTGLNTLAYMGVEPLTPPAMYNIKNPPTPADFRGFNIGDFWTVNNDTLADPLQLWVLLSLEGNVATWEQLFPGGGGAGTVTGLRGDNLVVAFPVAGIINVSGSTNITTVGAANSITVELNNSIFLPDTTADGLNGVIYLSGIPFLHDYGTRNTFLGSGAGNLTLNVPFATDNVAIGTAALTSITDASLNVAVGSSAGASMIDGLRNTLVGAAAGTSFDDGDDNVAVGASALGADVHGFASTAVGSRSLLSVNGGPGSGGNTALGYQTGFNLLTGVNNIFIGANSGQDYVGAESSNILINSRGSVGESNRIRIGADGAGLNQQDACYIAGIYNRTIGAATGVVQIDSAGKLGSSRGTNGQLLISGGTKPDWANLTSLGGTIAITNGVNTINLEAIGSGSPTVQVAFLSQFTPNQTNQTGDGTVVTIGATQALTEIFDVGNNLTTAGVFTAPVTAKYYLELSIELTNLTAGIANAQTCTVQIVTTARTYVWHFSPINSFDATLNDNGVFSFQQVVDMSATDTAHFTVATGPSAGGGVKDIGIGANTFISGFLISGAGMGTVALEANDTNLAAEAAGIIKVFGDTVNLTSTAAGDTLTMALTGFTNHALPVGTAAGKLTSLAAATNGQLPIGSTGADPVIATLTAGVGINIVNGAGSITISSTGGSGGVVMWNDAPVSTTMVVNNGYVPSAVGLVTLTLPAVAAFGTVFRVAGAGAGGWRVGQQAGQTILFGNTSTTIGVGGHLDSTNLHDCVELLCIVADTAFTVLSSIGNITVV